MSDKRDQSKLVPCNKGYTPRKTPERQTPRPPPGQSSYTPISEGDSPDTNNHPPGAR